MTHGARPGTASQFPPASFRASALEKLLPWSLAIQERLHVNVGVNSLAEFPANSQIINELSFIVNIVFKWP